MLVLQDTRRLRLEVMIPENYVDKVDLKQQVTFVFNALPGQENKAYIRRSANALGTIEVDVTNKDQRLKPGMYGEAKIPLILGAKSLLVPNNAIVRSTEREYVIKVVDGKAVFADIKEGITGDEALRLRKATFSTFMKASRKLVIVSIVFCVALMI